MTNILNPEEGEGLHRPEGPFCPLTSALVGSQMSKGGLQTAKVNMTVIPIPCMGKKCGFWSHALERCAVPVMAVALDTIGERMEYLNEVSAELGAVVPNLRNIRQATETVAGAVEKRKFPTGVNKD